MIDLNDLKAAKESSDCLDQHVAAGLYKGDKLIIAASNCAADECKNTDYCLKTRGEKCPGIHAERALVALIIEQGIQITPQHSVIVTLQPCYDCICAIMQIGIQEVYYIKRRPGCTWTERMYDDCHVRPLKRYLPWKRFDLGALFGKITKYQKLLNKTEPSTKLEKVNLARLLILSMQSEVNEVLNTMDWKYWRQTNGEIEYEHFKEEMADVFFFWVELLNVFNVPLEEIEESITDKLMVNYNRMNGAQK